MNLVRFAIEMIIEQKMFCKKGIAAKKKISKSEKFH